MPYRRLGAAAKRSAACRGGRWKGLLVVKRTAGSGIERRADCTDRPDSVHVHLFLTSKKWRLQSGSIIQLRTWTNKKAMNHLSSLQSLPMHAAATGDWRRLGTGSAIGRPPVGGTRSGRHWRRQRKAADAAVPSAARRPQSAERWRRDALYSVHSYARTTKLADQSVARDAPADQTGAAVYPLLPRHSYRPPPPPPPPDRTDSHGSLRAQTGVWWGSRTAAATARRHSDAARRRGGPTNRGDDGARRQQRRRPRRGGGAKRCPPLPQTAAMARRRLTVAPRLPHE